MGGGLMVETGLTVGMVGMAVKQVMAAEQVGVVVMGVAEMEAV